MMMCSAVVVVPSTTQCSWRCSGCAEISFPGSLVSDCLPVPHEETPSLRRPNFLLSRAPNKKENIYDTQTHIEEYRTASSHLASSSYIDAKITFNYQNWVLSGCCSDAADSFERDPSFAAAWKERWNSWMLLREKKRYCWTYFCCGLLELIWDGGGKLVIHQ